MIRDLPTIATFAVTALSPWIAFYIGYQWAAPKGFAVAVFAGLMAMAAVLVMLTVSFRLVQRHL